MTVRVKVGDVVQIHEEDCCLAMEGRGIVEAVKYVRNDAMNRDDLRSITIGGITITSIFDIGAEVL